MVFPFALSLSKGECFKLTHYAPSTAPTKLAADASTRERSLRMWRQPHPSVVPVVSAAM
jgi:hypothetical protein